MIPAEHVFGLVGFQEAVAFKAAEHSPSDRVLESLQELGGEGGGFVEAGTGFWILAPIPRDLLEEAISGAYRQLSGLGRTARGFVMSATPGKVLVTGVSRLGGEDVFVLGFLQARDPSWVGRPFFARFDPSAAWLDEFRPAFGESEFFFEAPFREIKAALAAGRGPRRATPPLCTQRTPKARTPTPAWTRRGGGSHPRTSPTGPGSVSGGQRGSS